MSNVKTKSKNVSKRGPRPHKRDRVILAVKEKRLAGASDLGVSSAYLNTLVARGILVVNAQRKCEGRGRPANLYSLSPRGRGFALNLSKKKV